MINTKSSFQMDNSNSARIREENKMDVKEKPLLRKKSNPMIIKSILG